MAGQLICKDYDFCLSELIDSCFCQLCSHHASVHLVKTTENVCHYSNRTIIYVSATGDSRENTANAVSSSRQSLRITLIEIYIKGTRRERHFHKIRNHIPPDSEIENTVRHGKWNEIIFHTPLKSRILPNSSWLVIMHFWPAETQVNKKQRAYFQRELKPAITTVEPEVPQSSSHECIKYLSRWTWHNLKRSRTW